MGSPRRRPRGASANRETSLGNAVLARRLSLGMTQRDLADLADVSRSSVQALEAGDTGVSLAIASAVAAALGERIILTSAPPAHDSGHGDG